VSATPFKLAIAALGGQGGAVLTGWLIEIAEANAYLVQSTSVPGVAQRTGATLYYLEFFPRQSPEANGREPVMALMPVAGDVDCVVAAELVEAGRALARGLVTPERTTLIASSHREYTIGERSAMGRTVATEAELVDIARAQAQAIHSIRYGRYGGEKGQCHQCRAARCDRGQRRASLWQGCFSKRHTPRRSCGRNQSRRL
jgi:indolepyruvate ferredoxin oxidoreductase beta subunit